MLSIQPFRFLHTGDLHLDSPFQGIRSRAPEWVAGALRDATVRAWQSIVDLAVAERVDFVVVAGDVFENATRTLRGQVAFVDGLRQLSHAAIPSFVVTGNHDPLSGWEPTIARPDGSHRFGAERVDAIPVVRGGAEIARVYGISYAVRDVRDNLARQFRRESDAPFAIGLLHANVGGQPGHELYAPCSVADLAASGMDYWALGHVHRHAVLQAARPTAVYCGNPQGRDPGESGARGCYVVAVDAAGIVRPEFHAADVVRWLPVEVEIGDLANEDALLAELTRRLDEARAAADGRSLVVRMRLMGRGALHATIGRAGFVDDLRGLVQESMGTTMPFVWIDSIADGTRPEVDLAAIREQASGFLAEFLRETDATRAALAAPVPLAEEPDAIAPASVPYGLDPTRTDEVLATLYEHPRLRRALRSASEDRPRGERLTPLIDRAETLVVDRLADEG
ncbi:MAG: exonuclease SbcCD subunit D [Candidatus Limnocylindria bacterium]